MAMKVLIIGGTRYLGPRLVKGLVECGHEPVLFNRGRTNAPMAVEEPVRSIIGDRNEGDSLRDAVAAERYDAVVDTQAFSGPDARRAVDILEGKIGRYLAISSVACYGRLFYAPADENHPYMGESNTFPGNGGVYASGKRDVERVLFKAHQEKGFPVVVIRPSVSYGYGRLFGIWGYSTRHVSRIKAGKEIIVPDSGEGLIQPVFIDDEAAIIEKALRADNAVGEAFNCAGPQAVPLWQYFRAHEAAVGRTVRCVQIPALVLEGFDPVLCVRASQNLIFNHAYDVGKLEERLGFTHAYSLEDGLKETVAFQEKWGLLEPTGEQDPDDRIIDAWRGRPDADLRALGERIRKDAGYVLPEASPLIKWAPDHFRLGE